MIIGIGTDLVDIRRIESLLEKFGKHFAEKIFTAHERSYAENSAHPLRVYANRFAAKEAAAKALGTGFREGIGWHDIEVLRTSMGAPTLSFHGKADERFFMLVPPGYVGVSHVSFSDEPPYSSAFVVLSANVSRVQ
ncbi:MAG: holo-ACP synthase [Alphaproteobacteria bacterium]|nr:holo-ACP synthase [Alphaproteobacteria bacterium]